MAAEEDVLGDGERGHDAQFLIDHADAAGFGLGRRIESHALPPQRQLPLVGGVDAAEDLHQRALAGAVFTDEAVDLAGQQVEIDAVKREGAAEPLGDAGQCQERLSGEN